MDRKLLITIAVTALVTATVTELVKAVLSVVRRTATSDTTRQNVKNVFTRARLKIAMYILFLLVFVSQIVIFYRKPALTGREVVECCVAVISALFWFVVLSVESHRAKAAKKRE